MLGAPARLGLPDGGADGRPRTTAGSRTPTSAPSARDLGLGRAGNGLRAVPARGRRLLGEFDARVHWGKLHFLTAEQLLDRYPRGGATSSPCGASSTRRRVPERPSARALCLSRPPPSGRSRCTGTTSATSTAITSCPRAVCSTGCRARSSGCDHRWHRRVGRVCPLGPATCRPSPRGRGLHCWKLARRWSEWTRRHGAGQRRDGPGADGPCLRQEPSRHRLLGPARAGSRAFGDDAAGRPAAGESSRSTSRCRSAPARSDGRVRPGGGPKGSATSSSRSEPIRSRMPNGCGRCTMLPGTRMSSSRTPTAAGACRRRWSRRACSSRSTASILNSRVRPSRSASTCAGTHTLPMVLDEVITRRSVAPARLEVGRDGSVQSQDRPGRRFDQGEAACATWRKPLD